MSDKKFEEANGDLAFSQSLMDKLMQSQAPQQEETPPQSQQEPEKTLEHPQSPPQEVPQQPEEKVSGADLLTKAGQQMQESFGKITEFFMKNEEKEAEETKKREEKHTKELGDIKNALKKIVEE